MCRGGGAAAKMYGTAGCGSRSLAPKVRVPGSNSVRVENRDPGIELWILKKRGIVLNSSCDPGLAVRRGPTVGFPLGQECHVHV